MITTGQALEKFRHGFDCKAEMNASLTSRKRCRRALAFPRVEFPPAAS